MISGAPDIIDPEKLLFGHKYVAPSGVAALLDRWRGTGIKPAVVACSFELLHVGCVRFVKSAACSDGMLLVAVYDDQAVAEISGPGRPVLPLHHRIDMVASLESVNAVTHISLSGARELSELPGVSFIAEGEKCIQGASAASDTCSGRLIQIIKEKHAAQTA